MSTSNSNIIELYNSRNNILEILEERGFNIDDYKNFSINDIGILLETDQLDMLLENKDFKVLKRKRMLLDTIYISILSKNDDIGYVKLSYIIIKSIFITLLKGPRFSSSLLYICEKNN